MMSLYCSGTAIMNESALTGESVPQCKVPLVVDKENEVGLTAFSISKRL